MKILLIIISIIGFSANANITRKSKVKYRTYFGKCPSRVVGNLTLKLVKTFEETSSLKEIKKQITRERLDEKHFLSQYDVKYNPLKKFLTFSFDCPEPLMKVQIYKSNGLEYYTAILVDNGKLFDPTYEYILETEKKLKYKLPSLALPVGEIDKKIQMKITRMVKNMDINFRNTISEIILDDNKRLTVILSNRGKPVSAFFGIDNWSLKAIKLKKIIGYLSKKRKTPTIINLTNDKKVVVKFSSRT
jgi:hypothetical protein